MALGVGGPDPALRRKRRQRCDAIVKQSHSLDGDLLAYPPLDSALVGIAVRVAHEERRRLEVKDGQRCGSRSGGDCGARMISHATHYVVIGRVTCSNERDCAGCECGKGSEEAHD